MAAVGMEALPMRGPQEWGGLVMIVEGGRGLGRPKLGIVPMLNQARLARGPSCTCPTLSLSQHRAPCPAEGVAWADLVAVVFVQHRLRQLGSHALRHFVDQLLDCATRGGSEHVL